MQLGINDYHIYTSEDIHHLIHYNEHKVRYHKIFLELENMKPEEKTEDHVINKQELQRYMKRKMLCFYNPRIAAEMFNLMDFDKRNAIERGEFCDYYVWFEEKIRERIEALGLLNQELTRKKDQILPELSSKRNDYIYVVLRDFKALFKTTSRWRGETHDISQLYVTFHHERSMPDHAFQVWSLKDSRLLNKFESFYLGGGQSIALRLDMNQITNLEIRFFKRFNPLKRKQRDGLVASAIIRLDTNLITRNSSSQLLTVELVETVDFEIEESLKSKFNSMLQQSHSIISNQETLQKYLDLKYRKSICCCCWEYRSLSNRLEYRDFKHKNISDIQGFLTFCENYGPFPHKDIGVFSDIKALAEEYQNLKQDYDNKQITIHEILATLTFEMSPLRSEDEFLRIKKNAIDCEIQQNNHEGIYLKEKLLHIYRLWGTLGIFDSINFFKQFNVSSQSFIGNGEEIVYDCPLKNLNDLDTFQEMGSFYKELFIWMPKIMLLMAILISFCRPDFLTLIVFVMIHPFVRYRWRMEHYYSAIFMLFALIFLDVFWMVLEYGDWFRVWYPENWRDFVGMSWFLSLINCIAKMMYMGMLAILAVREYDKV